ncbi:MAG: HAD family hydrolase [Phycisphaerales bacterium]|nr:HAD family hydrolase [Phycisphaerales bacterium]
MSNADRAHRAARRAVFLDRDGTIIEDTGFVDDPAKVRLAPGAADALARLRRAGFMLVVASNQSGVARGLMTEETVHAVNARIAELLGDKAGLDAFYYCPFLDGDEAVVGEYRKDSDWRKPRPGMLRAAAREHGIDLRRSWMIGDAPRDVEAGRAAGCRTVLLAGATAGTSPPERCSAADYLAASLTEAAKIVEQFMDGQPVILEEPAAQARASAIAAGAEAPTTPATSVGWPALPPAGEVPALLREIRDQLDRAHRRERQPDFSFVKLLGTLLQLLAIVAGLWGTVSLVSGSDAAAASRLLLACLLQLMCVTIHVTTRE